jgi:hypothetical protein
MAPPQVLLKHPCTKGEGGTHGLETLAAPAKSVTLPTILMSRTGFPKTQRIATMAAMLTQQGRPGSRAVVLGVGQWALSETGACEPQRRLHQCW